MNPQAWLSLCLTYIISLFLAGLLGFLQRPTAGQSWVIYCLIITLLSISLALILPRFFYRLPSRKFWLAMGLIAILSVVYFQIRLPHPSDQDISQILSSKHPYQRVIIQGKTSSMGILTASQRIQVWVKVNQVMIPSESITQQVRGKVYVTLPKTENTEIFPNQNLTLTGTLYKPALSQKSFSFNFRQYLERQGSFSGLKAEEFKLNGKPTWGWWKLRKRIVDSQKAWIPPRESALISSIFLGRKAVDLPYDLKSVFINAGMAHIITVSGFHIALLLGTVLWMTRYLSPQKQLIIGVMILISYLGLTGLQPSVLRASIMGIGGLIGLTVDRKTNSLRSLLLSATFLLLWNPLWLWDLGFQLSFLATFGLLVTLPSLQVYFDFLPPRITTFFTIPIAAFLWTFPLLIHTFSVISIYSVPLNIMTAPLVYIISLGGIISGILALIFSPLGSAIAWLLYSPTHLLIWVVERINHNYAIGELPLAITLIIYGLLLLTWLSSYFRKRWILIGLFIVTLLFIKPLYNRFFLTQVTLLSAQPYPFLIIQDQGKVILFNYGDQSTNQYTLIPFLTQQGIKDLDCLINVGNFPYYSQSCLEPQLKVSLNQLLKMPNGITSELFPLKIDQKITIGSINLQFLNQDPQLFQFQIKDQKWLWLLPSVSSQKKEILTKPIEINVLLWSGDQLSLSFLKNLSSKKAIALSSSVSPQRQKFFRKHKIELYSLINEGIIQWNSRQEFTHYVENENLRDF